MMKEGFGAFVAIVLLMCAAPTAHAQNAPTPLSISAGSWIATDDKGIFADTWSSGPKKLAFLLPSNSSHFMLQLSGFNPSIPDGTKFNLELAFVHGPTVQLPGQTSHNILTAQIPDSEVADFTHNLTADHAVLIPMPNWVWIVPLGGTTPTISALADAISFAGIKGLPAPFDNPMDNPTSHPPQPITEATSFKRDGYNFVIFDQTATIPDPESDPGADTIEQQLPQIVSPVTPQAVVFNQNVKRYFETAWANCKGPKTSNPTSHPPGKNAWMWAGAGTSDNDWPQDLQNMLPGVISIRFEFNWEFPPGHPGTCIYDFNWLMAGERLVELNDIFDPSKNWQKAMIKNVNTQRPPWPQSWPAPDLSKQIIDPTGWLLNQQGIELVFGQGEFGGYENGGATEGVVVPWSNLKPYLKKGGPISVIVKDAKS